MSKQNPTLFAVLDVETCRPTRKDNKGLVFDVAWKIIDRKANEYGRGSFLAKDVISHNTPYFKEKVGRYFELTYKGYVEPRCFRGIRAEFNHQVKRLTNKGYRVIFCAYNARFDCDALAHTSLITDGKNFLYQPMPIMCIWDYWSRSCPTLYNADPTASGKYVKTNAESVFAFEFNEPNFVESHIAWEDVDIETEILLKVLARKKKMPLVNSPRQLNGRPFVTANERLRPAA